MSATYGGVPLATSTPALRDWLAANYALADLVPFRAWSQQARLFPSPFDFRRRPVKINSLWWPTGASRWATGFFLVCEQDLEAIRALAYADDTYQPLTLSLPDGTYTVETDLWMLPALPLAQVSEGTSTAWTLPESPVYLDAGETVRQANLYLLPLVDDRYFWWERAADIDVDEGTTTWAGLISSIGTALGVTIEHESVAAAYLTPLEELGSRYHALPLVLDAVAAGIGCRVVRGLDGTVTLQRAAAALESQETQLAIGYPRRAGGLLALDVA